MQSRKTAPGGPGGGPQHVGGQPNFNQRGGPPQAGGMRPPLIQRPVRPNGPLIPGQPRMAMPHQGMPPFGGGQPQWGPGMPPNGPPRPPAPMHPGAPPMGSMPLMRLPPQQTRGPVPQQPLLRGPNPHNDPRTQMPHPGGPMPHEWGQDGHPPHPQGPPGPQQMMMGPQPGQPQPQPGVIPPRVPTNDFPSNLKINFFNSKTKDCSHRSDARNACQSTWRRSCSSYKSPILSGTASLSPGSTATHRPIRKSFTTQCCAIWPG